MPPIDAPTTTMSLLQRALFLRRHPFFTTREVQDTAGISMQAIATFQAGTLAHLQRKPGFPSDRELAEFGEAISLKRCYPLLKSLAYRSRLPMPRASSDYEYSIPRRASL